MLPDKALRNLLWDKIKDSKVMALDLSVYDNMLDKDPDKTYQKLREIMAKWIRKSIETTNKKEREKAFGNLMKATPRRRRTLKRSPRIPRPIHRSLTPLQYFLRIIRRITKRRTRSRIEEGQPRRAQRGIVADQRLRQTRPR